MELSRQKDQKNLETIYESIINEMTAGSVTGGSTSPNNNLLNDDDYATGDDRVPYLIGKIMTRTKALSPKNSKKSKKKKKNRLPF